MADSHICAKCGATIPAGSIYCPRCGTKIAVDDLLADTDPMLIPPQARATSSPPPPPPVVPAAAPTAASPATAVPPPVVAVKPPRPWWVFGVPIAVLVCGAIVWAVLMGMPFSHDQGTLTRATAPASDTVGERPGATGTVSQLGEPGGVQSPATTSTTTIATSSSADNTATTTLIIPTQMPPQPGSAPPMSPPIFVPPPGSQPQPGSMATPSGTPQPTPTAQPRPTPSSSAPQISERDAISRLTNFLISNNTYDVPKDCIDVRSSGYKNVGYTLNVLDLCGPEPRTLGRWRVDAVTREVFRQSGDGRFVRP